MYLKKKGSRFLEFYVCTEIIKNMHNEYNQRYLTLLHSSTDLCNYSVHSCLIIFLISFNLFIETGKYIAFIM